MSPEPKDPTLVSQFAAEMLQAGTHPLVAFVALYAMMLAGDIHAVDVRGTVSGSEHDFLLIEITPSPGDFGKVLGKGGEILDTVRNMAQRMAKAYGLHVEIKLREAVPQKHGNRR